MEQDFSKYTASDREVWKILFERQYKNLMEKGSTLYLESLNRMSPVLNNRDIPDFNLVDKWFKSNTGWSIAVVPGLIPVNEFFQYLANKQFCSSTWLRDVKNLDYLEEPDMFHDIFGHVPLLSEPVFSSFMQKFGMLGVKYSDNVEIVNQLQRLYWFTIEFGVIKEDKIKSYGAGIMSSFGEANHVDKGNVTFTLFNLDEIIKTEFRTDVIQEKYFVLDSFEQLFNAIVLFEKKLIINNKHELEHN